MSEEYEQLAGRLKRNREHLSQGLTQLGLTVLGGQTPIISVLVGDEADTLQAGAFLFERGYYVQSVVFPAVPYHAGVLRIQVNANHSPGSIQGLIDTFASLQRCQPVPSPEPGKSQAA